MSQILDAVERERQVLTEIRAYLDDRESKLDQVEQAARTLEPLNFEPAARPPEPTLAKPTALPTPRRNGRRAERVKPPGLPPPSRTQDKPNPAVLDSAGAAGRASTAALSREQTLQAARQDDQAALAALAEVEPVGVRDLAGRLGWDPSRTSRVLQRLREKCEAQAVGTNRWAKWYLTATLDRQEAGRPGSVDAMARDADRELVQRRLRLREDVLRTVRSEPAKWSEERIVTTKAWDRKDVAAVCGALLEEGILTRNYDTTYSLDEVWLATSKANGDG